MIVNGQRRTVPTSSADPQLSLLISSEGPIVPPRIPAGVARRPAGRPRRARRRHSAEGRGTFRHEPLGGDAGDNVELRWTWTRASRPTPGSTSSCTCTLRRSRRHLPVAQGGCGRARSARHLRDPQRRAADAGRRAQGQPPRGRRMALRRLATPAALDALLEAALRWLETTALGRPGSTCAAGVWRSMLIRAAVRPQHAAREGRQP